MDTATLNQEENMVPEYEYKHVQKRGVELLKENMALKAEIKYLELLLTSYHDIINDFNINAVLAAARNEEFDDPRTEYAEQIQQAYDNMMDIQSIIEGEL